ncbi:MAG: phosphoribosylanthranilate isomerase [Chloroflexota bacterium]
MTVVKICGITQPIHAVEAADAGADMVGLIFAPSSRQVTLKKAQEIVSILRERQTAQRPYSATLEIIESSNAVSQCLLRKKPAIVGVFVNASVDEVNSTAEAFELDIVQLSGDEPWERCSQIRRPVIKAVHIRAEQTAREVLSEVRLLHDVGALCLLDTKVDGFYGGTGNAFDWTLARQVAKRLSIVLAGGLTPENVGEAIRLVHPFGVDVSSGVETGGMKDIFKIRSFIEVVRGPAE